MKPIEYFGLNVMAAMALVVLDYIPFVQDVIANSGYSAGEVLGGIFAIVFVLFTFLFVVAGRW